MSASPGALPQSQALAEASADSLSELFSRAPETLATKDLDRIIEALRAQRERWAAAEAAGVGTPKTRSPKAPPVPLSSPAELDL